jgi:metallo-beta-lactamase class B
MEALDRNPRSARRGRYETSIPRVVVALAAGSSVGACLLVLQWSVLIALAGTRMHDLTSADDISGTKLVLVTILTRAGLAQCLLAAAIVVPAGWWILHRLKRRRWFDGLAFGLSLGLTFFTAAVALNPEWHALSLISYLLQEFGGITYLDGKLTPDGWIAALAGAFAVSITGAAAGLVVWMVAYRESPPRARLGMMDVLTLLGGALAVAALALALHLSDTQKVPRENSFEVRRHIDTALATAGPEFALPVRLACRLPESLETMESLAGMRLAPAKVFDNLYHVGTVRVSAWAITTSEGIVLIDSLTNRYDAQYKIVPGLISLGLDPSRIRYVVVTHGHFDHYGGARYLQDTFGARIVMGSADWDGLEALRQNPSKSGTVPVRDIDAADGGPLTLGDTAITIVHTPGHTDGTISVIFPVVDQGTAHMAAIWGGNEIPNSLTDTRAFRASLDRFAQFTKAARVDTLLSNHAYREFPSRIVEAGRRGPGMAHPFVTGEDAYRRFMQSIGACADAQIARLPG